MYRTVSDQNEDEKGSKYVTYMRPDRDLYRGAWESEIRSRSKDGKTYENSYELKEDLNIPSRKELQEVHKQVLSDKKLLKEAAKSYTEMLMANDWDVYYMSDKERKEYGKRMFDRMIKQYPEMTSDDAFLFSARSLGKAPNVKNRVIEELSKRGYNAMTDEASVGGFGKSLPEGYDPLIIFEGSKTMAKTGSVENTKRIIDKASKDYSDWQRTAIKNYRKNRSW